MAEFYFSVNLAEDRTLCLAPLTERRISLANQQITDSSGYFLYETRGSGENASVEVIAQVFSEEAAFLLRDQFHMD
jgi:hypothetical protein